MLLYYKNWDMLTTCCLQVAPMDYLMEELMKLSRPDKRLTKHSNLVMCFLTEIELNKRRIMLLIMACRLSCVKTMTIAV